MMYKNTIEHFDAMISFFTPLDVMNFDINEIKNYIIENFSHEGIIEITRQEYQNYIVGFMDKHDDLTLHDIVALEILDCKMFPIN